MLYLEKQQTQKCIPCPPIILQFILTLRTGLIGKRCNLIG